MQYQPSRGRTSCNSLRPAGNRPLTKSGFLRIYGHPFYIAWPGSPGKSLLDLRVYRDRRGHHFLPCDFSFNDPMSTSLSDLAPQRMTEQAVNVISV
ncbi:MAG: hypothetical protein EOP83_03320 [Verrucomicrobiaceae bacterium]|nr:MAG: hypothetical protein EOP83_03320 [Verrucomicrobiaceae bacterium]